MTGAMNVSYEIWTPMMSKSDNMGFTENPKIYLIRCYLNLISMIVKHISVIFGICEKHKVSDRQRPKEFC